MTEYGVWDDEAGGVVHAACWSPEEAGRELARLRSEDPEAALSVVEICPDHDDQPKRGCAECET